MNVALPPAPRPALVAETHAAELVAALQARARPSRAADIAAANRQALAGRPKLFHQMGCIAFVPIRGVLLNDLGCIDPWWGCTGYDGIAAKAAAIADDEEVAGTILDINSGGGEVAGVEACARALAATGKPMVAVLNEDAFSAAYWLACAADQIAVPRTGGVGSIGVVSIHWEWSRLLEKEGIALTVLRSGARKAEGNMFEPLSDAARESWQAEMDAIRTLFVAWVAERRELKPADLLATEARTIPAITGEATRLRLADAVATPAEAYRAFAEFLGQRA